MKLERDARIAVPRSGLIPTLFTASVLPLVLAASPASAETRGYVISWFATATNDPDFIVNCPQAGKDPNRVKFVFEAVSRKDLALVNGEPADPANFPDALTKDPNIETVVGKYAYGFDLGGPAANKFIDPQTHEKVDNQLWRAIGCTVAFQATAPLMPYPEGQTWPQVVDGSPGWAIQITGADLSKDGPVTVTLDRTFRHLERDARGEVMAGASYVLDPSPRSHNVLSGEIKNGMLTIKPGLIYLESTMAFYSQIDLKNAHMRMQSEPGGKLAGYWGGYTDWHKWAYMETARPAAGADAIGMYWALEKLADADPDPVTGKNRLISTTWRMEAVPAFLSTPDGKVVATATSEGLGGKVQQPTSASAADTASSGSSTATH